MSLVSDHDLHSPCKQHVKLSNNDAHSNIFSKSILQKAAKTVPPQGAQHKRGNVWSKGSCSAELMPTIPRRDGVSLEFF